MALLLLAGGACAFPGWWQAHLLDKARQFLAHGDARDAYLLTHEALNRKPSDPQAIDLMAQISQQTHSPAEIHWCAQLAALNPSNPAGQVRLAEAALRYGETFAAKHALDAVPRKAQDAQYHQAAANLAIAEGQLDQAQEELDAASRANPGDSAIQLRLEKLRLAAPQPDVRAAARERLLALTGDNASRLEAYRALLNDARAQKHFAEAKEFAKSIGDLPEAALADHLEYLEELGRSLDTDSAANDPASVHFNDELLSLETSAKLDGSSILALGAWLNDHERAGQCRTWIDQLPEASRNLPAAKIVAADSETHLQDWAGLQKRVASDHWGHLEYLRLAFQARAEVELSAGADPGSNASWQQARQAAGKDRDQLQTLAGLVESWGWTPECKELWWKLADDDSAPLAALQHLAGICRKRGETEELLRVTERIYRLEPGDMTARNNVAQLRMLLGRDSLETQRISRENASQYPSDWALNSTYAFSLHLQGRDREGIDLLLHLPGAPQQDPQIAAYLGVLYAATGQNERARPFLELAAAADLLPEEAKLVHAALSP
jgi:tetratricopeptide (TPR) repeat protein